MNKEFFILDSADQDDELDTTLDWHTLSRYRRGEGSLFTDEVSEVFNGQKYFKWARLSIQPGERDNTIDNVRRGCNKLNKSGNLQETLPGNCTIILFVISVIAALSGNCETDRLTNQPTDQRT